MDVNWVRFILSNWVFDIEAETATCRACEACTLSGFPISPWEMMEHKLECRKEAA